LKFFFIENNIAIENNIVLAIIIFLLKQYFSENKIDWKQCGTWTQHFIENNIEIEKNRYICFIYIERITTLYCVINSLYILCLFRKSENVWLLKDQLQSDMQNLMYRDIYCEDGSFIFLFFGQMLSGDVVVVIVW
jgi:hypothetical protein